MQDTPTELNLLKQLAQEAKKRKKLHDNGIMGSYSEVTEPIT